jgi:hypothetical protein
MLVDLALLQEVVDPGFFVALQCRGLVKEK